MTNGPGLTGALMVGIGAAPTVALLVSGGHTSLLLVHDLVSDVELLGGVVANSRLRELASRRCAAEGIALRVPPLELCTDNGAMIAALGAQLMMAGHPPSALDFGADSTLPVTTIQG